MANRIVVDDPTDIQAAHDRAFDPTASDLQKMEQDANSQDYIDNGLRQAEDYANASGSRDAVADAEDGKKGGWKDNTTKNSSTGFGKNQSNSSKFKSMLKKGGPTGGIVGGLIAAVLGIGSLLSPAALLNHITAGFVDKWDNLGVVSTDRSYRLLATKIGNDTTAGSCSAIKIACRYKTPSKKLLTKLATQGVYAVDADGKLMSPDSDGNIDRKRPQEWEFRDNDGKVKRVSAAEFKKTYRNNAAFRSKFHAAYNPRWANFASNKFKNLLAGFGSHKGNKTGDAKDKDDFKVKTNKASAASDIDTDSGHGRVDRLLREKFSKIIGKLGKSTRGNALVAVPGLACIATDIPGIISTTVRAYQMRQLIAYAMVFLTVADKIKAGDATPTEVSAAGTILTAAFANKDDLTKKSSAMDSFGMKYALFGNTNTNGFQSDYKKFAPGGNVVSGLSLVTQFTENKDVDNACSVVLNPLTGLAITGGMVATGAAAPAALILGAVGFAAGTALEAAAPAIIDMAMPFIRPFMDGALAYLLGDLTQDIEGEDVGNALASGSSHLMSSSASSGGLVPLSIAQAIAFDKTRQSVNLAYAEEDRATLSPLDTSSPNTFLGSIASYFMPYATNMASLSGVISSISSVSIGSVSTLINPTAKAADTEAQYKMCDDRLLTNHDIAAGPFCNVVSGIPIDYMGADPSDVLDYMVSNNQIDGDTGAAVADSEYDAWIANCSDGDSDQARSCMLDSFPEDQRKKYAYFALYTVDSHNQALMDGEEIDTSSGDSPTDGSDATATGTTSAEWSSYKNGEIPISAMRHISTVGLTGCKHDFSSPYLAPSALRDLKRMYDAYRLETGRTFKLESCYRSFEQQEEAKRRQLAGTGNKAATPGTSNHGWSKAVDISTNGKGYASVEYKWLKKNARKYNWVTDMVSGEAWHIEYIGNLP